jgi:5-methylcytosine-specific restriction endonuclease McrA
LFLTSPSKPRKFCSIECVNKPKKEIWNPTFQSVRKNMLVRNLIKECERCGYNEVAAVLGVHHKDRNRKNNAIENLEVLCPNCHSIEHNKHIAHGFKK